MTSEEIISLYFKRMGMTVPDTITPDAETLRKLHMRHVMMIPYENTDYLSGNIKTTDFETQFSEVIIKERGGMCIDMNPLFGQLLSLLGYKVHLFATRISQRKENDLNFHVILNVEDHDGGVWWCDVANPFTRYFEPLLIETGVEQSASGSIFRFEKDSSGNLMLFEKKKEEWIELFRVIATDASTEDRNRSKFEDFEKYPENAVFCKEVFSIVTPTGRRTLTGNIYRESVNHMLYQFECTDELMPWAYSQFGLKKD